MSGFSAAATMPNTKAFNLKSEILPFQNTASLCEYLKVGEHDLVLIDGHITSPFIKECISSARVIVRSEYGNTQNTSEVITQIATDAGAAYDRVIGIGGGKVMDVAKILALESIDTDDFLEDPQAERNKAHELILIPTTIGSGSEVTPYSALFYPSRGVQIIVSTEALCADRVLLCPELLEEVPFNVIAAGSFDAFNHACESFMSPRATSMSRIMAEKAISILIKIWKEIAKHGTGSLKKDLEQLQLAGTYAGISYANAGSATVNAIAYPLTIRLNIPHGEACYLAFSKVMEFYDRKEHSKAFEDLKTLLHVQLKEDQSRVFAAIDSLCNSIIAKKRLSEYGMGKKQIIAFTDLVTSRKNMLLQNSFDQLSVGEISDIFSELL